MSDRDLCHKLLSDIGAINTCRRRAGHDGGCSIYPDPKEPTS